jgi:hypothetical protein
MTPLEIESVARLITEDPDIFVEGVLHAPTPDWEGKAEGEAPPSPEIDPNMYLVQYAGNMDLGMIQQWTRADSHLGAAAEVLIDRGFDSMMPNAEADQDLPYPGPPTSLDDFGPQTITVVQGGTLSAGHYSKREVETHANRELGLWPKGQVRGDEWKGDDWEEVQESVSPGMWALQTLLEWGSESKSSWIASGQDYEERISRLEEIRQLITDNPQYAELASKEYGFNLEEIEDQLAQLENRRETEQLKQTQQSPGYGDEEIEAPLLTRNQNAGGLDR